MLNVRDFGGSYKGLIGECLFKFSHKYAVLTQLANPATYFDKRPYTLSETTKRFLIDNWTRIDAIEVLLDASMNIREVNIYEVKTQNYDREKAFSYMRPSVSFNVDAVFRAAARYGINAHLAKVFLLNDWSFDITISPYNSTDVFVCERPSYNDRNASKKWARVSESGRGSR